MIDANSTSEREDVIQVKPGSSRSSTIAAFYRAVDEFYSNRSAVNVQSESDTVDEDIDVRTDERLGSSTHVGEANSQLEGGTEDIGGSSSSTELRRSEVDEGATLDTADTPVEAGGSDVEPSSIERTEPESGRGEEEQRDFEFHFAPLFHSRGDRID